MKRDSCKGDTFKCLYRITGKRVYKALSGSPVKFIAKRAWRVLLQPFIGRGRIRTHEPLRASCFQDRRNRPLCHSSKGKNILKRREKFNGSSFPPLRELHQKSKIVFREKTDIGEVIPEHSKPLEPYAPSIATVLFGIDTTVLEHFWVHKTRPEDF